MIYLSENLQVLRRNKGLSQEKLAATLGLERTTLSAYEQSKAFPPAEVLIRMKEFFNVSLDEFICTKIQVETVPDKRGDFKVLAITVSDDKKENIEFVPVKAAAGYTHSYGDPEFVKELPRFRLPFLSRGTFRAFEIKGDSMLPIISGSIVIGEYIEKKEDIRKGDTYIVITQEDGILFKRVAAMNKQRIVLKSDNTFYESYSLPVSEIREIWKSRLYMSSNFDEPDNSIKQLENVATQINENIKLLKRSLG
jgi:transcriptional regulator with XRE-family HTH domain